MGRVVYGKGGPRVEDQVRLTDGPPGETNFHGVWSPDGKRIAWVRHLTAASQWDLMVADFVEQPKPHLENVKRLSNDTSFHETQDWTPDGRYIMETVTAEGVMNGEEFLTDPDTGEHVRRLTHNPIWDEQMHSSPDGRVIAMMSGRDNPGVLSSGTQPLASELGLPPIADFALTGPATAGAFAPGPQKMSTDYYLIDPEEGDEVIRRLTHEGDSGATLAEFGLSPDGRHLAWGPGGRERGLHILSFDCRGRP